MNKYSQAKTIEPGTKQQLPNWKNFIDNIDRAIKDPLLAGFVETLERCSSEHQVCDNCTRRTECLELWDKIAEDLSTNCIRQEELETYTQKFRELL